jgi:predicted transcriptional regulator YdeE
MEQITLDKDIVLLYVTASSFPDGIMAAHQQLHSMIPFSAERKYYGISFPEDDKIIYKAAAEEIHPGEAAEKGLETFTVKKGEYASIPVSNFMSDTKAIGEAFQKLLKHPQLDPKGFCLEWYVSKEDVQCMVPLKQNINQ